MKGWEDSTAEQALQQRGRKLTGIQEGDTYDAAETITDGYAPHGSNTLMRLQEPSDMGRQTQTSRQEYDQLNQSLRQMQAASEQYLTIELEVKCAEHELTLIDQRINGSEHHTAEQALTQMRTQLTEMEDGDLYDPAETITGGSAPHGINPCMRLLEPSDIER